MKKLKSIWYFYKESINWIFVLGLVIFLNLCCLFEKDILYSIIKTNIGIFLFTLLACVNKYLSSNHVIEEENSQKLENLEEEPIVELEETEEQLLIEYLNDKKISKTTEFSKCFMFYDDVNFNMEQEKSFIYFDENYFFIINKIDNKYKVILKDFEQNFDFKIDPKSYKLNIIGIDGNGIIMKLSPNIFKDNREEVMLYKFIKLRKSFVNKTESKTNIKSGKILDFWDELEKMNKKKLRKGFVQINDDIVLNTPEVKKH